MLLVMVGEWREVEVVGVGDLVRGLFAGELVWGDVDPHGGGLCARNADGCARCSRVGSCRASLTAAGGALCCLFRL